MKQVKVVVSFVSLSLFPLSLSVSVSLFLSFFLFIFILQILLPACSTVMPTPSTPLATSSNASLQKELLKAFPAHLLTKDHACMPSLVSLLQVYSSSLTAEDLYYKVEAILVHDRFQRLTLDIVEQLKNSVQREWEAKAKVAAVQQKTAFATPAPKSRSALGSL